MEKSEFFRGVIMLALARAGKAEYIDFANLNILGETPVEVFFAIEENGQEEVLSNHYELVLAIRSRVREKLNELYKEDDLELTSMERYFLQGDKDYLAKAIQNLNRILEKIKR